MGYNLKQAAAAQRNSGSQNYEPLPSDRYNFKVTDAVHAPSKSSSNWKIELTLKVLDGDYQNRMVWHNLSMSPKAIGFLARTLTAMGKDELLEQEDVDGDKIAEAMVGATFSAMAEPDITINGNSRTEVDSTTIQAVPSVEDTINSTFGPPPAQPAPKKKDTAPAAAENDMWS